MKYTVLATVLLLIMLLSEYSKVGLEISLQSLATLIQGWVSVVEPMRVLSSDWDALGTRVLLSAGNTACQLLTSTWLNQVRQLNNSYYSIITHNHVMLLNDNPNILLLFLDH